MVAIDYWALSKSGTQFELLTNSRLGIVAIVTKPSINLEHQCKQNDRHLVLNRQSAAPDYPHSNFK
jgi:hypothetical protein